MHILLDTHSEYEWYLLVRRIYNDPIHNRMKIDKLDMLLFFKLFMSNNRHPIRHASPRRHDTTNVNDSPPHTDDRYHIDVDIRDSKDNINVHHSSGDIHDSKGNIEIEDIYHSKHDITYDKGSMNVSGHKHDMDMIDVDDEKDNTDMIDIHYDKENIHDENNNNRSVYIVYKHIDNNNKSDNYTNRIKKHPHVLKRSFNEPHLNNRGMIQSYDNNIDNIISDNNRMINKIIMKQYNSIHNSQTVTKNMHPSYDNIVHKSLQERRDIIKNKKNNIE